MTLTVLTDDQIRALLENLTVAELEGFSGALASALHEYSTGTQGGTATHQPERISVHSTATGATTLFMPSHNSTGNGIKVITLTSPAASSSPTPPKPTIRPTGAITLFTPQGTPLGLLHASTLTAFRTALASHALVQQRTAPLKTLVVFGCGEQAYWHVRLTLLTRGAEVGRVVFVNRRRREGSSTSYTEVVARLTTTALATAQQGQGQGCCEFGVLAREDEGYDRKLGEVLREADVVFCCTPSTEPLFDAGVWEEEEAKKKGRLVVAIGSYTPEMREVRGELVRQAIRGGGEREAGVVVVDTIEGALKEAGELIAVGVRPEQLVELGELVIPETAAHSHDSQAGATKRDKLAQWLQTGNVIYKSVGLGLMDLSIGMHIVKYAQEKGVGTQVQGF
ncbi:hypothetical protein C8A00DRAFT_39331 [Chaetomidium leptoderma]|uniref:NAD(P)-binding protein n=1 Tax=Chaetomidium leptoderma TaxID=669021 RepID=A0AAN6VVS8_9PEZI|nr:hypothetical protein C8A00DRAFT_39331 [Chaetomidium leptoderma]